MPHNYTNEQVARFWSKVSVKGPDECWEWLASKHPFGYGMFRKRHSASNRTAHRVAWEITHNVELTDTKLHACHKCDNPPCVNPSHIFIGTAADNQADKVRKNRQPRGATSTMFQRPWLAARGDNHGLRKHPERAARGQYNGVNTHPERLCRGSNRPDTTLTEADVAEIRRARAAGATTQSIASRYNIGKTTVFHIVARDSWKHVVP